METQRGYLLTQLDLAEVAFARGDEMDGLFVSIRETASYFAGVALERLGGLMGEW